MPDIFGAVSSETSIELLERADELSALGECLEAVQRGSRGQVMLVAGEAGVGKTTLVRRSARSVVNPRGSSGATAMRWSRRVHSGRCSMSRGLGRRAGRGSGECGDAARGGGRAAGELRRRAPTVFVLDDVHWADEATLDVLRLLARRVETVPALVIRLRKRAARAVPRGPRAQTRENPAGLTARELDVIVWSPRGCVTSRSPSAWSSLRRQSIITSRRSWGSSMSKPEAKRPLRRCGSG